MPKINVLDCTLRDGGYINNWKFEKKNIQYILKCLLESKVEYIECGYFSNKAIYSENYSIYNTFEQLEKLIPETSGKQFYVGMINIGEFQQTDIPPKKNTVIEGIRIVFHKEEMKEAIDFAKEINEKGYKVFLQPMVSMSYTDLELLELFSAANEIHPFAFYIVDSFGVMKQKDLLRLYYLAENNLEPDIMIGFHSHNNLQLSYSNAQAFASIQTKRKLIVDSSIMGMGRGAGNLNTELFLEYLNDYWNTEYIIQPLLNVIDKVLNQIYTEHYWGYSLPYYISAKHDCHPNYASFLADKSTLKVKDMDKLMGKIEEEYKSRYSKEYAEKIYMQYQQEGKSNLEALDEIKKDICGQKVIVIAPGISTEERQDEVILFCRRNKGIVISVNFQCSYINSDYIFVSNNRRYDEIGKIDKNKLIITSNIEDEEAKLKIQYSKYLNSIEGVKDNACMMLFELLYQVGAKEIFVVGLDGYSYNFTDNYVKNQSPIVNSKEMIAEKNSALQAAIKYFRKKLSIEFIVNPKWLNL